MNLKKIEQALDFYDNYEKKVAEAVDYIRKKSGYTAPQFGIILGSGWGDFANLIEDSVVLSYDSIPNFPITTVEGHEGKLVIGKLEDVSVIVLKGRTHFYEVADQPFNNGMLQVVFPIHVLAGLGVSNHFITNASGGLNRNYKVGDSMIIKSHINLLPNPLLGRQLDFRRIDNHENILRFEPMNSAYDPEFKKLLLQAGAEYKKNIHEGFYLALTGPAYETEAECIAFRDGLKADAVGMSTAPEVIAARSRGIKVVGLSCISNVISKDGTNATNHEEVKTVLESKEVKERLFSTVRKFFNLYQKRGSNFG